MNRVDQVLPRTRGVRHEEDARQARRNYAPGLRRDASRIRTKREAALNRDLGKCDDLCAMRSRRPARQTFVDPALEILGRGNMAESLYEMALTDEKREIEKSVTSDLLARRKSLQIKMRSTFQAIPDARNSANGAPRQIAPGQ